jgi:selenocysteine lyase/cysteine desulfurase
MEQSLPRLLGADTQVPCADGRRRRYVNLDHAASTPVMAADRVGVAAFTVDGHRDAALADALSARHAIGVRNGCFCAHPLMSELLAVPEATTERLHAELRAGGTPDLPGAVRASLGVGTTASDVDHLVAALHEVVGTAALRPAA